MDETPDKGPIRFLANYLKKHDLDNYLIEIANNFPNIEKWTGNADIDRKLSNEFWTNPRITDAQKTCLIKFRTGQYMGNFRKQLFFGIERFPSTTCSICNSTDPDTWLHVLLKCKHPHMHGLIVQRHNAAVREIRKLLLSASESRCLIYMNAGTFNDKPPENTVPPWLLPCTCNTQKCHCNARLKPDLLCVQGLEHNSYPPDTPTQDITIQFVEFTYCNDRFSPKTIDRKHDKYKSLEEDIKARGWKIEPLIIVTAGARAATHIPSMDSILKTFKISKTSTKNTFKEINVIAIQYAKTIQIHKRKLENNQPLPIT